MGRSKRTRQYNYTSKTWIYSWICNSSTILVLRKTVRRKRSYYNRPRTPCTSDNHVPFFVPALSSEASSSVSTDVSVESPRLEPGDRRMTQARRNRWQDLQDRPEELEEKLVGAKSSFSASDRAYLPEQHCDHLLSSRSSGMCNILTYFPKDGISEICRWIKITRAPHRRRVKNDISRAPKFGDIITADHKVLSKEGELRNNHRSGQNAYRIGPKKSRSSTVLESRKEFMTLIRKTWSSRAP